MTSIALLQAILDTYKIPATVIDKNIGSRITQYKVSMPLSGTISSLKRRKKDIAMHLGVTSIRIFQDIGQSSVVCIEIPNDDVQMVKIKEIISSDEFKSAESNLSIVIGKNTLGDIVVGDLRKMPHLLVGGTTGSGKTVFLKSLILSLLYKNTMNSLELLLIDPKGTEFFIYDNLPHLIAPVIDDSKKAVRALNAMVKYMESRYLFLKQQGCSNAEEFNNRSDWSKADEGYLRPVVIIIDELADLMLATNKKAEEPIVRLAQKARGCGVHLVAGTQRPSVDVVTGLMKANFPSRIAFTVKTLVDSRVILDSAGAEQLTGMGDMLYQPINEKPVRVQGAYVTSEEVDRVLKHIKENNVGNNHKQDLIDMIERRNGDLGMFNMGAMYADFLK